jgi:hypothetical protein
MDTILIPNQIDLSKIKYGAVKTNPIGGKSIYVSHNNSTMLIQTPEMRSPFGLSKWDKKEKGADGVEKDSFKYDLLLGFDGMESREMLNTFYNKMSELDTKLIADGMENSMNWLGKKMTSTEVVEELYTPLVRQSRDKNTGEINNKYPANFKISVPYRDGKFQCTAYGPNKKEIDLSTVNLQGARITVIIQCVGIWVVGKKFGCSWKGVQMMINPKSNIPKFAFQNLENESDKNSDNDDDDDESNNDEVKKITDGVASAEVEDSDDDEDEEDELNAKVK